MKRNIRLSPRCLLCGEEEVETTNILWNVFINLKGMKWVMPRKITKPLKIWSSYASIIGHKEGWKIIPLAFGCLCGKKEISLKG